PRWRSAIRPDRAVNLASRTRGGAAIDEPKGEFTMRIRRHFTIEGSSPYEGIEFRSAASEIRNPDGTVVFRQDNIEVPADWSQVACDVVAQKYFRKAGVPVHLRPVPEDGVPEFILRREADGEERTG